jgi:hypothetical protein
MELLEKLKNNTIIIDGYGGKSKITILKFQEQDDIFTIVEKSTESSYEDDYEYTVGNNFVRFNLPGKHPKWTIYENEIFIHETQTTYPLAKNLIIKAC